jgi:hypothetical protein
MTCSESMKPVHVCAHKRPTFIQNKNNSKRTLNISVHSTGRERGLQHSIQKGTGAYRVLLQVLLGQILEVSLGELHVRSNDDLGLLLVHSHQLTHCQHEKRGHVQFIVKNNDRESMMASACT